jgi:hypothetical protein
MKKKDKLILFASLVTEAMSIAALSLGYGTKIIASPSIAFNGEKKADFD